MSTSSAPPIGVIEHPELAAALTRIGLTVIGGGAAFLDAVRDIRAYPTPMPVVIADDQQPGLRGWAQEQSSRGTLVVLEREGAIPAEVGIHLREPVLLGQVLQALGFGASAAAFTDVIGQPSSRSNTSGIGAVETPAAAYMGPPQTEGHTPVEQPQHPEHIPEETRPPMSDYNATPEQAAFPFAAPEQQFPQPLPTQQHANYAQSGVPQAAPQHLDPAQQLAQFQAQQLAPEPVPAPSPQYAAPAVPQMYQQPAPQGYPTAPDFGFDQFGQPTAPSVPEPQFQMPAAPQYQAPVAPVPEPQFQMPAAPQYQEPQYQQPVAPAIPEPQYQAPQAIPEPHFQQPVAPAVPEPQYQAPQAAPAPQYQAPAAPQYQEPQFQQPAGDPFAQQQFPPAPLGEAFPTAPSFPEPAAAQAYPEPLVAEPTFSQPEPAATLSKEAQEFNLPGFGTGAAFGATATTSAGFPEIPEVSDENIKAKVIVSYGGKGGVGKTTCAVLMAQRAAAAGLRVVVVDMNRGQGNIRSYLRLDNPNLPTVYNAAVTGKAQDALISPKVLKENRDSSLPSLGFAVVMSPPHSLADPKIVSAAVYSKVIRFIQTQADLVILDTQIVEAKDTSGLIDNVMVPLLMRGAWGLGVADMSRPGREDLLKRTQGFINQGVKRDRLMLMVNKAQSFGNAEQQQINEAFSGLSAFLGAAGEDPELASAMNSGSFDVQNSTLRPILDTALYQATGKDVFLPDQAPKRRGLFGRRR
jgi:Mrp family chromosome partitioning ATPase